MSASKPDIVFEVGYLPQDAQASLEALEMILAAAALEMSLVVMFDINPSLWLAGPNSKRWRQLIDFGLAELLTTQAFDSQLDMLPVRRIEASEAQQIRANARTILVL